MTTVGQALVAGLKARGVEVIFGIPGVHTIELYRGLADSGIRHITPRHEQGACFMADGYARVSGKPGVAFVITGPGLTNALTAMAQAKADSVPMLVVSGVNRRASLGRGMGLLHELPDQAALVAALCPTERVEDPAQLGPALDRAFTRMATGRPGPVHIEIPTDVMGLACADLATPTIIPAPAHPEAAALAQATALLNQATRPVILAGGGARRAEAALQKLAETLDAPVIQTVNARGMMHGHALTVAASASLDAVRGLITASDRVLALGTELGPTDYDVYARGGVPDLSGMIRVDICADQLARHPAALPLHGDVGAVITSLLPDLMQKAANGAGRAAATRAAAMAELPGLHPAFAGQLAMVEAVSTALPGAIVVGDSTQPVYAANLVHDHDRAAGWFNAATGYGTLGYAPGAAIGAAIAAPGVQVVCLIGDGGLQFSPAELRAAADAGVPVTFVVWNNAGYREIAENMRDAQISVIGCTPSPLILSHFAAACGLPFASVPTDPAALCAALKSPATGPRLIEIRAPA
jgi:acetolactate synthase I/II/III large subunit